VGTRGALLGDLHGRSPSALGNGATRRAPRADGSDTVRGAHPSRPRSAPASLGPFDTSSGGLRDGARGVGAVERRGPHVRRQAVSARQRSEHGQHHGRMRPQSPADSNPHRPRSDRAQHPRSDRVGEPPRRSAPRHSGPSSPSQNAPSGRGTCRRRARLDDSPTHGRCPASQEYRPATLLTKG
jgi:hypothetical protein